MGKLVLFLKSLVCLGLSWVGGMGEKPPSPYLPSWLPRQRGSCALQADPMQHTPHHDGDMGR